MRNPTPQFRMADRLSGGSLASELLSHRASGLSLDATARRLYADHGIEVTRQTVANWLAIVDSHQQAAVIGEHAADGQNVATADDLGAVVEHHASAGAEAVGA